jgi:hypothetical protein
VILPAVDLQVGRETARLFARAKCVGERSRYATQDLGSCATSGRHNDDVVDTLAAHGTDQARGIAVLPVGTRCERFLQAGRFPVHGNALERDCDRV